MYKQYITSTTSRMWLWNKLFCMCGRFYFLMCCWRAKIVDQQSIVCVIRKRFAKELSFWNGLGFTKMFFGEMLWIQVKWVGIVMSEVWGLWIVKLDLPFNIYCIVLIKGICWVHEHGSVKYDIIVDMVLLMVNLILKESGKLRKEDLHTRDLIPNNRNINVWWKFNGWKKTC